MVAPLVPLALLGASAGANLYKQYRQKQLYDQLGKGYHALDKGYRRYLAGQGRKVNPNRALTSYYGQYLRSRTNSDISLASSVGSTAGTLGAGAYMTGKTWRFMK